VHSEEVAVVIVMGLMILAGVAVLLTAMQGRRRVRAMEHRERLAMIERGIAPSPEADPAGFEGHMRAADLYPRVESEAAARSRSLGVIMIGLGVGVMMLITFAADSFETGFGVGGAFVALGVAFYVNSRLMSRADAYQPRPAISNRMTPRSSEPPQPPANFNQ
jgi:hypothetical protein